MSRTFQVGDRVLNTFPSSIHYHEVGTVSEVHNLVKVKWDSTGMRTFFTNHNCQDHKYLKLINQSQSINLTNEVIL